MDNNDVSALYDIQCGDQENCNTKFNKQLQYGRRLSDTFNRRSVDGITTQKQ